MSLLYEIKWFISLIEVKGDSLLILVNRSEFDELRNAGLIRASKYDKNYRIVNKKKCSKRKKYYVVEERAILNFLNREAEDWWEKDIFVLQAMSEMTQIRISRWSCSIKTEWFLS